MILPARSATLGTQRHPEHRFTEQLPALVVQVSTDGAMGAFVVVQKPPCWQCLSKCGLAKYGERF